MGIFRLFLLQLSVFIPNALFAANTGMPYETVLEKVGNSISGPVAHWATVIIIALTGIAYAAGEHDSTFKKFMRVGFGLSIVGGAVSWGPSLFGVGGGFLF